MIQARLVRIEAVNPGLAAVTVVLADEALDAAADCDRKLTRGEDVGPCT